MAALRQSLEAWVGCVAGALEETEYRRLLQEAGFDQIEIEVTRVYDPRQVAANARGEWDEAAVAQFEAAGGRLVSAFVRARKPIAAQAEASCCGPTCCPS